MSDINDINLSEIWSGWEIEKRLGKGSYGTVYKAVRRDHHLTSYAAVKVLSIPQDPSEIDSLRYEGLSAESSKTYLQGIVDDFVNEIQLMESFKGLPNIVSVEDYEVIEKENEIGWDIYIRMELLTPFNEYACDKKLTESDVVKLGCDICSALEICDKRNIIHRDVKPENIFINDFGFFKLGDFGIARKLENMTSGLSQKGTPLYMAPEVFAGNNYDSRADIYSLGIVLYRLLNQNRLPFISTEKQLVDANERALALERRKAGEPLPPPCDASPELAYVILKACAHNPDDRYANAAEFKNALKKPAINTPPIPVPPPVDNPAKNKRGSHAGVIIASLITVAIIAAIGVLAFFFLGDILDKSPSDKKETTEQTMGVSEITETSAVTEYIPTPDDSFASGEFEIDIYDGKATINYYKGNSTTLEIPSEIDGYPVNAIGEAAFYFCSSITEVTIPDSVTTVGDNAFGFCQNLEKINVSKNNPTLCSDGGILFSKDKSVLIAYPCGKSDTSYEIPGTVTAIGSAFDGCSSLEEITIPSSVTAIGDRAFYYCDNLSEIRIPGSVTTIGENAFGYCESLERIVISDSVTSIGENAFYNCINLTEIDIPNSVDSIGNHAFADCFKLSAIYVSKNNASYCDIDGVLFSKDKNTLVTYPAGKKAASYTVPNHVTAIGNCAFRNCHNLTGITISDKTVSIGDYAFHACHSITELTIPDSVTSIGNHAFDFCENLKKITLSKNLVSIGDYAFNACDNLSEIVIPSGVTSIGEVAFGFCESIAAITIPDSVASIGENAFLYCDDIVIKCSKGSYADKYASENSLTVEYN